MIPPELLLHILKYLHRVDIENVMQMFTDVNNARQFANTVRPRSLHKFDPLFSPYGVWNRDQLVKRRNVVKARLHDTLQRELDVHVQNYPYSSFARDSILVSASTRRKWPRCYTVLGITSTFGLELSPIDPYTISIRAINV